MRKLSSFIQVSLDGYYADADGDMSFAQKDPADAEWNEFVSGNASGGGALMFGRATYEMMARFWPTPAAAQAMPAVAERMNALPKFVFSRTMEKAPWANTTVLNGPVGTQMRSLKAERGPDITTLGSGMLVAALAEEGVLDTLQIVVCPVILGGGKHLFAGLEGRCDLKLIGTRTFKNGSVLLDYAVKAR